MSWGPGRQNSPRLAQSSGGPSAPRPGPHDYSPSSGADQRVVNGGAFNTSSAKSMALLATAFLRNTCRSAELYRLVGKLVS